MHTLTFRWIFLTSEKSSSEKLLHAVENINTTSLGWYSQRNKYWFPFSIPYQWQATILIALFYCEQLTDSVSIGFLLFHYTLFSKKHLCYFCHRQDKSEAEINVAPLYHNSFVKYDISNFGLTTTDFARIYWKVVCFPIIFFFSKSDHKAIQVYAMINWNQNLLKRFMWMSLNILSLTWFLIIVTWCLG